MTDSIRAALHQAAGQLRIGLDADGEPFEWQKESPLPGGVGMSVLVNAARRLDAGHVADRLNELAERWGDILRGFSLVGIS
jgi:hypothetical protein